MHHGGGERQCYAATPSLLVGKKIGRDYRFAVAGTRGMKDAVSEGNSQQAPKRITIRLGCADHAGERTIKQSLLLQYPTSDTADHGCVQAAERIDLGVSGMDAETQRASDEQDRKHNRLAASRHVDGLHGQVTKILLAKFMPIPTLASDVTKDLLSR